AACICLAISALNENGAGGAALGFGGFRAFSRAFSCALSWALASFLSSLAFFFFSALASLITLFSAFSARTLARSFASADFFERTGEAGNVVTRLGAPSLDEEERSCFTHYLRTRFEKRTFTRSANELRIARDRDSSCHV